MTDDTQLRDKQAENGAAPCEETGSERFRVGTLIYSKRGLITLLVWLLWGDFCWSLMETVLPSVMPLRLRHLGGSNSLIGLLVTTIPSAMNFIVNPVISFRSDRYRGKWGRRIPFLVFSTPFLTLFLVMMGFSSEIGAFLHTHLFAGHNVSPTAVVLGLIGVATVCFQFFNMFVSSVYYYLFNDVVPEAYLGRFMALFRVAGSLANCVYSLFIYKYAETNSREILVGAGILYFVSYMAMCLMVKEGKYPPPPENVGGKTGIIAGAKTYFSECFTHGFYWLFFLTNSAVAAAFCMNAFAVFLPLSLGLTLAQLGTIGGIAGIITTILLYPAGILCDRLPATRVMKWVIFCQMIMTIPNCIFLFFDFLPGTVYKIWVVVAAITLPINVLYFAASLPMYMRLLPKERYGQFGSADAMVRSAVIILGGVLAGFYLDRMKLLYHGSNYYYRFIPIWQLFFTALAFVLMTYLHRYWQKLGGADSYTPPEVGCPVREEISPNGKNES